MAIDQTTYEDVKTVHQQSITVDDALEAVDGKRTWITGTQHVLAAEVRRLREASAVTAVNFGKAHLKIAQLEAKLSIIEAVFRELFDRVIA